MDDGVWSNGMECQQNICVLLRNYNLQLSTWKCERNVFVNKETSQIA